MTTELTEQVTAEPKAKDSAKKRELRQTYYFKKYDGTGEKKINGLMATVQRINEQEYLTVRKVNNKGEVEERDKMDFTYLIRNVIGGATATGYNELDITCRVYEGMDLEFKIKMGGRK